MQSVPLAKAVELVKNGMSVRPNKYQFVPHIWQLMREFGADNFRFAQIVSDLAALRAAALKPDFSHLVICGFRVTASSVYFKVLVPCMRFKRVVVVTHATPGVASILRGMMPGVIVLVGTALIEPPPSVRRLHAVVTAHQRTTDEADLCAELPEPLEQTEPLDDFQSQLPACLVSGCKCGEAAAARLVWRKRMAHELSAQLICAWCGHAGCSQPACMLCGCGVCDTCFEKDRARLSCSCQRKPEVFSVDLTGQLLAGQFVIDSMLVRGDDNFVFSAHLAGSELNADDRWDRLDGAPAGAPSDRVEVVVTRVHVLKALAPLLEAPGILPPVRTTCSSGAAFIVFAFGGHRFGEGPAGDYQVAATLQVLWTLATVCGSLQACQLILADLALSDFIIETVHGQLCARLQLTGASPQRLQTQLQPPQRLKLRNLIFRLAEMVARLAGQALTVAARGQLRDLIGLTALVAGTFPASLGGGQFDVADLQPESATRMPDTFRPYFSNTVWLTCVAGQISELLNTPLRNGDQMAAGAWADAYRAP